MFKTSFTAKDVADRVKRTFGDESGVQVTDTDIIRWVNAAQLEIASKNQILKAKATTESVAGQYAYSLSEAMDIQYINSIHYEGAKLKFESFNDAEQYIFREDPKRIAEGTPTIWYEWAGSIELFPIPDKSGDTITVYYHKLPDQITNLSDTLSVPDNYYNRITEYVLAQAYEMDENLQAHQTKMVDFADNLINMSNDEARISVDTYPMITILPEDY